ncbi:MAG: T9SS type A sorting domain-containing protein, partial [Chitinophagaceae bacterium]|nr:T9SS type A sorting domain-containing protein [Chitinophagaceae bacterium]
RLIVDMQNENVSADGVHIGGTFNNWGATKTQIISLENNAIYEGIIFIPQGTTHEYKFYNGATIANAENVPSACAVNTNRSLSISADNVFDIVCFSSCAACTTTGIETIDSNLSVSLNPNPSTDKINIQWNANANFKSAVLTDISGKVIRQYQLTTTILEIEKANLNTGMYFLNLNGSKSTTYKLIFE